MVYVYTIFKITKRYGLYTKCVRYYKVLANEVKLFLIITSMVINRILITINNNLLITISIINSNNLVIT